VYRTTVMVNKDEYKYTYFYLFNMTQLHHFTIFISQLTGVKVFKLA